MRLSFGQELRMVQKQILAPRMIQSMEILQLPILALQERIDQEMQENEALELQELDPDLPEEQAAEQENPDAPTVEERELVVDEKKNNEDDFERLLQLDEEWPDHFEERSRPSASRMEEEGERKHDAMANAVDRPESLNDYLHHQLSWFEIDPTVRQWCDRIIYNLDANGYLQGRLEDFLEPDAPPAQLELARQALSIVQKLDPPGVGARDLKECLLLQLVPGMEKYEQLKTLISNHLEDLEHNRLPQIERKTGYSLELIKETLEHLRHLNPKPGAAFTSTYVQPVEPDVFVELGENGKYKIRLEDGRTPNLFISPYYRKLLLSPDTDEKTREYIKRKINAAQWLIESIEQRRNTLTRVSQAIVDHQTEFLNKGPEAIEPLKMQQIADKVGVHVTTVSRAVDDKWIQTPRGIFPLKRFFVGGTVSAAGEEVAWDTVRMKLQEIIDKEDKANPLSDDDLVSELGKHGLTVARRTVTKYRKAMNIPSSRQRRDWTATAREAPKENGSPAVEALPPLPNGLPVGPQGSPPPAEATHQETSSSSNSAANPQPTPLDGDSPIQFG
ncbi:MAG TPA: RNA polymerase factor sigma-54 [Pirellulales bacterium]|nr:RNA polymerase factor sigma-54 [Pirellulales bacterium]